MARSFVTDPLLTSNFALMEVPVAGLAPLAFPFKAIHSQLSQGNFIGFQSINIPELSVETEEIRQGNYPYVHRVVTGFSTGGEVTLSQAVLPYGIDMYLWFMQSVQGILGPRRNLLITHTRLDKRIPVRLLSCENCIPTRYSPSSNLVADTSSVCTETLTFWTQRINVIILPETATTGLLNEIDF